MELAALIVALATASPLRAQDIGHEGPQFTGAGTTPTEAKPQSKLWFNDGVWWGSLWSSSARAFHVHRYDFAAHTWTDTGVEIDARPNSHCDALWDGTRLYVASHQFVTTGGSSGNPMRLYRYSYVASARTYALDPGFPVTIGDHSTEALVIAKDSTGKLWAAWTQGQRVRINRSLASDTQWGTPLILPANTSSITTDDLCGLVHFHGDRIGVLWSDQNANAYRFSMHLDGASDTAWSPAENATSGESDDHLNLAVHSDGRVFCVGKNVANNLLLLVRALDGAWSRYVVSAPTPILTRPIVLLDEDVGTIHVFATAQDTGEVYEKYSSLTGIFFGPGPGIVRMRDASAVFRISNPTSTKQRLDRTTGIVVLAHHETTGSYWHHLALPAPPVADFGGAPTRGPVPLYVEFTDASTGNVTARSWSFGDGGSSSAANPGHTYAAVGTYSVGLTVSGPGGADTETKPRLIEVLPPAPVAAFGATPASGMAPLDVVFDDQSTGAATSRSWSFGDGASSTAVDPTHRYATAGTFSVSLTVTGPGGSDTETKQGLVHVIAPPPPVAEFGAFPTNGIVPLGVAFSDQSTGVITSRSWSFGDGTSSSAAHPNHLYETAGTFSVSLTVTGPGGSDTMTRADFVQVRPPPPPSAGFGASPTSGVMPLLVSFSDASTGSITSRTWSFGDGSSSSAIHPRHVYAGAGSYTVSLTVTGPSGTDAETRPGFIVVVLPPPPEADFSAVPTSGEVPLAVSFTDASTGNIGSRTWSFGDGSTSSATNPNHFYANVGTYTVSLTAIGPGGSGTETKEGFIVVRPPPPPAAAFSAFPTRGDAPLTVTFRDETMGDVSSCSWSFGDGASSTQDDPTHVYSSPGAYTVALTAHGPGGTDTETKARLVVVSMPPPPELDRIPADSSATHVLLPVADARVSEGSPGLNAGADPILRVRSNADSAYHSYVRFDLTGLTGSIAAARLRLYCTNESSSGGQVFPTSSAWSEGTLTWANAPAASGGPIASAASVEADAWVELDVTAAVGAGPVSLLLTSTSSDSAMYSSREGAHPPELVVETGRPVALRAEFSASPLDGTAPLAVTFEDRSTGGPTSWSWSFGDGATSSERNPTHVYAQPGTFAVTLGIANGSGSAQVTKPDLVHADPPSIRSYLCVADARVSEGAPSLNAGSDVELRVREDDSSYHSFVRFDLTGLTGTVTSARLRLYCTDASPSGGRVFPTSSVWSESTLTWANAPAATGTQVASAGGVSTDTWVEFDVTGAVGAAGLLSFRLSSLSPDSARYSSREGAHAPELVIETDGVP